MKTKYFGRETRKFGEGENPTFWLGGGDPTSVSSLMEEPEEWAKHGLKEQIEQNGIRSIKYKVLKLFIILRSVNNSSNSRLEKFIKSKQANKRIQ